MLIWLRVHVMCTKYVKKKAILLNKGTLQIINELLFHNLFLHIILKNNLIKRKI